MAKRITKRQRILALAHEGKSYEEILEEVGSKNIQYVYQVVSNMRRDVRFAKKAAAKDIPPQKTEGEIRAEVRKEFLTLLKQPESGEVPADVRALLGEEVDDSLEDAESDCGA
jgi:hypothetical protein